MAITQTSKNFGADGKLIEERIAIVDPKQARVMLTTKLVRENDALDGAKYIVVYEAGSYFTGVWIGDLLALTPTSNHSWLEDVLAFVTLKDLSAPLSHLGSLALDKDFLASNPNLAASLLDQYVKLNFKESLKSGRFAFEQAGVKFEGKVDPSGFIENMQMIVRGQVRTSVVNKKEAFVQFPRMAKYVQVPLKEGFAAFPNESYLKSPLTPTFGLGIQQPIEGVCFVFSIVKGSSADKAGIVPGTKILRFAGVEIGKLDSPARRELIARAGDSVDVEVALPQGEIKTLKLTRSLVK